MASTLQLRNTPVSTSRTAYRQTVRRLPSVIPRHVSARPLRPCFATYTVTLKTPGGGERTFQAEDDAYLLDQAEEAGIELPYRYKQCSFSEMTELSGQDCIEAHVFETLENPCISLRTSAY